MREKHHFAARPPMSGFALTLCAIDQLFREKVNGGWHRRLSATRNALEAFKHQFTLGFVAFENCMGASQRGRIDLSQSLGRC